MPESRSVGRRLRGTHRHRSARTVALRLLQFHKTVEAPLRFVFGWCTDYREDDDRLTDDLYHYSARILLRERDRIVREIVVPGRDRNRCTDVELIRLAPPDRWSLQKFSVTDDETGRYQLFALGPGRTRIEMRFRQRWKVGRPPDRARYRRLFNRVWDRYVRTMEREDQGSR